MNQNQYKLRTIYFYLTEGCNLRCRHCWINPPYENGKAEKYPYLDFEIFKDIIQQGRGLGLSSVKLTGGEPLIHPDIEKILEYICEQGLRLVVETNGVKCTPKIAEKILKCKNAFVSVSMDGSDAQTHEWVRGVKGCFESAMRGVRNLVRLGYRPQIIMSIMNHNKDQIESLVRMAEKENAGSVKFNLVTPTARGEMLHKSGEVLSVPELVKIGSWVENTLIPNSKIRVIYSHPIAFRSLNKIFGGDSSKCDILHIIGVLGSGNYALCGIGESVPELVFGNAAKNRLSDIWNNNKILNDIRENLPQKLKGICGECLIKEMCLGTCIALNYYRYRDLFAGHWYCDEAYKAKLFPATRIKPGRLFANLSPSLSIS